MVRSLSNYVDYPAVVAVVLVGGVLLVWAAAAGGPLGQVLAIFIGIFVVLAGLALLFVVLLKRLNADIGTNRQDIQRKLDELDE